jgi:hypothetical protein
LVSARGDWGFASALDWYVSSWLLQVCDCGICPRLVRGFVIVCFFSQFSYHGWCVLCLSVFLC